MNITDEYLERINAKRSAFNKTRLTRDQVRAIPRHEYEGKSGSDLTDFLVGYLTGFPMPSAAGITGAVLHTSSSASASSSDDDTSSRSSSYDSGSSSSDSGGYSDSSFD